MCQKSKFNPNWAIPVGYVLEEHMKIHQMSINQLSHLTDIESEIITACLQGKSVLNVSIAKKLQNIFGLSADIWLGIENQYIDFQKSTEKAKN